MSQDAGQGPEARGLGGWEPQLEPRQLEAPAGLQPQQTAGPPQPVGPQEPGVSGPRPPRPETGRAMSSFSVTSGRSAGSLDGEGSD